jgi:cytochrome b subunit of formate dehydrogenase
MKRKSLLLTIFFLLILIGNVFAFYLIREDFRDNTLVALNTSIIEKDDVKWINENYNFYQLKLENNKLKYDIGIKMLWTVDILIILAIFTSLKLRKNDKKD